MCVAISIPFRLSLMPPMKRVWQVIDREMRREGLTAKQMALKLQMDPAHLSRLRSGRLRDLSAEILSNLVAGLRKSPELHSELLAAYLSDKLEGSRHFKLKAAKEAAADLQVRETANPYGTSIPDTVAQAGVGTGLNRRVADALGTLAAQARTSRRLQALLISLADYSSEE
jgi:hypothetical protein